MCMLLILQSSLSGLYACGRGVKPLLCTADLVIAFVDLMTRAVGVDTANRSTGPFRN
jgi:hypothetical protein